jgi:hypothetical protein
MHRSSGVQQSFQACSNLNIDRAWCFTLLVAEVWVFDAGIFLAG